MTNEPLLAEMIDQCDVVFHLAAAVGVKLIVEQPVHTIETNVHGTEVVLKHANKKKKLVIIASTSEVYGKSADVPFREGADLVLGATVKHRWAYACSKLIDEFLALAYWKEKKLPIVIVRLFNTVGPRQTGQYGMVLPTFVRQALAGQPITVFGDGTQSRSFTYVADVVDALVKLAQEPRAIGEVFNIGNTEEVTIRDLAERVKRIDRQRFGGAVHPLRRGVRGRIRGHAAPRPGHHQGRPADRLPAAPGPGRDHLPSGGTLQESLKPFGLLAFSLRPLADARLKAGSCTGPPLGGRAGWPIEGIYSEAQGESPMNARILLASALVTLAACPRRRSRSRCRSTAARSTLSAENATVRAILNEWARVGGTRVVNAERIAGPPITVEFKGAYEQQALESLLRGVSGYLVGQRVAAGTATSSGFDRIVILATSTAPRPAPVTPAVSRPPGPQPLRRLPVATDRAPGRA